MKFNDLLLGLLVFCGGVAIWVSALGFTDIPGQSYGAGTMPRAIAIFAGCLGLFMIAKAAIAGTRMPRLELAAWVRSRRSLVSVAVALALIVFYIVAAPAIGFVPASLVVMVVLMLTLRTRPLTALLVSVVACVVIQQAFGRLLLVPLPRSEFLGFLW
ncbi:tripartite tricarboxylate transporter TctB family protein [Jiella sonneratiae]|uniref:Tripartite tricarboxylate transporter TctB family protein n=1 Tax=Jiella sonneratiae TaxID=2816856 RepID=A0ABS3J0V0_9HYPH|nr:tripartite tricarboxylate transporter TctB family protein [Jiella sonneratiae]MBO0903315.1 tripartite tricarboxylate transporter TctB family protein [Jiella sonneratiae]